MQKEGYKHFILYTTIKINECLAQIHTLNDFILDTIKDDREQDSEESEELEEKYCFICGVEKREINNGFKCDICGRESVIIYINDVVCDCGDEFCIKNDAFFKSDFEVYTDFEILKYNSIPIIRFNKLKAELSPLLAMIKVAQIYNKLSDILYSLKKRVDILKTF